MPDAQNNQTPLEFIEQVEHEKKRADALTLLKLMEEETGYPPKLWGTMIGYGRYHYRYDSGREGEWFLAGFAPRKQRMVVYVMSGFDDYDTLREKLGKHKIGKACLYINKLADVDETVLREMVRRSTQHMIENNTVMED